MESRVWLILSLILAAALIAWVGSGLTIAELINR
jgi:hypothetical protein